MRLNLNRFLLLLLISISSTQLLSQTTSERKNSLKGAQFGILANIDFPFKQVMPNMESTGIIGVSIAQSPVIGSPFYIELKGLFGIYATENSNDVHYFANGNWYAAEARYTSGYQKYLLGTKIMAGGEFRVLRFYSTPQIGLLRMSTQTNVKYWDGIIDPNNPNDDGTEQANRTSLKQMGFVYGGEAGLEISLQRLFKKESEKNRYRVLLSGSFLRGFKPYNYMNVDKELLSYEEMNDHLDQLEEYTDISHPNVDEYQFTKTYTSPLQLWGVNIGFIFCL